MSSPTPPPQLQPASSSPQQQTLSSSQQPPVPAPTKAPKPPQPLPPAPLRSLPPPYDQIPSLHRQYDERRHLHEDVQNYIRSLELSPDWIEVENRPWSNDNNRWNISGCQGYDFVQYDPRVRMRFFWNERNQILSGSAFWDNRTEGPAGGAYGGSIMLVFDEILAYPVWRSGTPAFTANVNLNLRKMVPFNTSARFESQIVKIEGRKVFVEAKILTGNGEILYADAKGLWISSSGIGSSAAVHPETLQQDLLRKEYFHKNNKNHGDFTSNLLLYPMHYSSAIVSSVQDEQQLSGLIEPQSGSVLPYQKHFEEENLVQKSFYGSNQALLPPQAINPRDIEANYGKFIYARL